MDLMRHRAVFDRLARIIQGDAENGQGLAEYALILALIAIVAIVALIYPRQRRSRTSCRSSAAPDISGALSNHALVTTTAQRVPPAGPSLRFRPTFRATLRAASKLQIPAHQY